jgi:hypothetical protein
LSEIVTLGWANSGSARSAGRKGRTRRIGGI